MIRPFDNGDRDWHLWFAWHPVTAWRGNTPYRVWWEYVERKTVNAQGYLCHSYRLPPLSGVPQ